MAATTGIPVNSSDAAITTTAWNERLQAAQMSAEKALRCEREGRLDAAYALSIQTAQAYLWLIRNTQDAHTRDSLKASSAKVLARAEKIKTAKRDVRPVASGRFDSFEQADVLEASSSICSRFYRRWPVDLGAEPDSGEMYSDPDGHFALSEDQKLRFADWIRMQDVAKGGAILDATASPTDIQQNCVSDCSVISGLIACLRHHRHFSSRLGVDRLHPQDCNGWPIVAESGKYRVRLTCNGSDREVIVDDFLPVDGDGVLLCAKGNFWAACMEKAYLRLYGGYQILGSDPSTDIHAFTGWIPQRIILQGADFRSQQTWRSLVESFGQGHCVLTIGTGLTDVEIAGTRFASRHAFAILDTDTRDGQQLLRLADPWRSSGSCHVALEIWLPWEVLCSRFYAIYCNWNPRLFTHMRDLHGRCSTGESVSVTLDCGPSIAIEPEEVWISCTRHMEGTEQDEYLALQVHELMTQDQINPQAMAQSLEFSNSPHLFIKYRPERPQARLAIALFRQGPRPEVRFTIQIYSKCPIEVEECTNPMQYTATTCGRWNGRSAGGNPSLASFVFNPQYTVNLSTSQSPASLHVELRSMSVLPVNIKIMQASSTAKDQRIQQYETARIVCESGKGQYSRSCAVAVITGLPAGLYHLVPSTFEGGNESEFEVTLRCTQPVKLQLLPQLDAGRFSKTLHGSWGRTGIRQAGTASQPVAPSYVLAAPKRVLLRLRLRAETCIDLPIKVAVYLHRGGGQRGAEVASSGPFAAYVAGCTVDLVQLPKHEHGYIIEPLMFLAGAAADFELTIISTAAISVRTMSDSV